MELPPDGDGAPGAGGCTKANLDRALDQGVAGNTVDTDILAASLPDPPDTDIPAVGQGDCRGKTRQARENCRKNTHREDIPEPDTLDSRQEGVGKAGMPDDEPPCPESGMGKGLRLSTPRDFRLSGILLVGCAPLADIHTMSYSMRRSCCAYRSVRITRDSLPFCSHNVHTGRSPFVSHRTDRIYNGPSVSVFHGNSTRQPRRVRASLNWYSTAEKEGTLNSISSLSRLVVSGFLGLFIQNIGELFLHFMPLTGAIVKSQDYIIRKLVLGCKKSKWLKSFLSTMMMI